jgi:hypothetical protein
LTVPNLGVGIARCVESQSRFRSLDFTNDEAAAMTDAVNAYATGDVNFNPDAWAQKKTSLFYGKYPKWVCYPKTRVMELDV